MKKITTRLATMDDVDQLAVVFDAYRQFYELAPDLALSRQFILDRMLGCESVLILAEDEGGVAAGFCQLYPTFCSLAAAPIYALYDLYVRPAAPARRRPRAAAGGRGACPAQRRCAARPDHRQNQSPGAKPVPGPGLDARRYFLRLQQKPGCVV
ncbi:hypothetical protein [Massilia antarctica]|uniref:hypothetical protein n=1 Tax=Massilia antarctica TaxID=2765360 RepID=UPI003F8BEAA0